MKTLKRQLSKIESRLHLSPTGPGSKCVRLTPEEIKTINESIARVKAAIERGDGRETLSLEDQSTFDIYTELDADC